jgi:hypothetical protein
LFVAESQQRAPDWHCETSGAANFPRGNSFRPWAQHHEERSDPNLRAAVFVLLNVYSLEILAKLPSNFVIVIVNGSAYDFARSLKMLSATCSPNKMDQKDELRK